MNQISACEAKRRLGQLLDMVEAGEKVVITRRGKVIAHIVPANTAFDRERALHAAQRIREKRKGVTLGGLAIEDLIHEGRR